MALSNYNDLISSVKEWTHRQDLDAVIPDFVKLAEVRIAQDLKVQALETTTQFNTVIGQESYDLPSGMVSLVRMWIKDQNNYEYDLIGFNAQIIDHEYVNGIPDHYYIERNKINLSPVPDGVYQVTVVHSTSLNLQTDSTNAIMTKYPNIYLFSTLIETAPYIGGAELSKLSLYEQRYSQAIKDANRAENFNDEVVLMTEISQLDKNYFRWRGL